MINKQILRLIADFEGAVRHHALKGSKDPRDHDDIEEDYRSARDALLKAFVWDDVEKLYEEIYEEGSDD